MLETQTGSNQSAIADAVVNIVSKYLASMEGEKVTNLHAMVLEQVEETLFDTVLPHFHNNQLRAAHALGLSRGTVRKKLKHYFGDKYCGEREK